MSKIIVTNERPDVLSAAITRQETRRIKARQEVERLMNEGAAISLVLDARRTYIKAQASVVRLSRPGVSQEDMESVTIADMIPGSINFEVELANVMPRGDIELGGINR